MFKKFMATGKAGTTPNFSGSSLCNAGSCGSLPQLKHARLSLTRSSFSGLMNSTVYELCRL